MKLYTTTQVATRLGISLVRVWQLIKLGRLPAEKIGRDWFIKEQDLLYFKNLKRPVGRPRKERKNG